MISTASLSARLLYLCEIVPPLMNVVDDCIFSEKPLPEKWSKKEILGHLIDSAVNNHQRFVRGQFENCPKITYDQNLWNLYNYYQKADKIQLIHLWEAYNRQLAALFGYIPAECLSNQIDTGDGQGRTLIFLIGDYVAHLEHHLKQIVDYPA